MSIPEALFCGRACRRRPAGPRLCGRTCTFRTTPSTRCFGGAAARLRKAPQVLRGVHSVISSMGPQLGSYGKRGDGVPEGSVQRSSMGPQQGWEKQAECAPPRRGPSSMGPQLVDCGRHNVPFVYEEIPGASMEPQQSCGKFRRRSMVCTEQCFNGAAERKKPRLPSPPSTRTASRT